MENGDEKPDWKRIKKISTKRVTVKDDLKYNNRHYYIKKFTQKRTAPLEKNNKLLYHKTNKPRRNNHARIFKKPKRKIQRHRHKK